jgi:hypothetical protein
MTSTSTLTTVVCGECRHENEPERIYCHGCGARLDRSAVKVRKEDVQDARKRVKKLFDPQRARIRALFFKISKVVLGACALAVFVQIILPPDVPAPVKTVMLASQIRNDLESATMRHQPSQLQYTDEQVNAFLLYALKTKQKALDEPLLDFKRAVVVFQEGSCAITVERSLFGYSLFTTAIYAPKISGGKLVVISKGGRLGRLPIHPLLTKYMDVLFADVFGALEREEKLVAKMGSIEFHDKAVLMTAATP